MGRAGLRRPTGSLGNIGGDLALRQHKGDGRGACLPDSGPPPAGAARPVATLIHEPELEAAIDPCCRHALRPLRDAQVYAQHHGGLASAEPFATGPLLTGPAGPLAGPTGRRYPSMSISCRCFSCIWRCHCRMHWRRPPPFLWASGRNFGAGTGCVWC